MRSRDDRGILNPRAGDERFTLLRHAPATDLADFVERHWIVRWDLRGREPFVQETLPFPNVNLVVGTHRPGIHGPATARFVAELDGEGWVVGTKFRPGAFRALSPAPMHELADRTMTIADGFGPDGVALDVAVHTARDDAERIALIEAFLRSREPTLDEDARLAARAVDLAAGDPAIARVSVLAERMSVTARKLQRVFNGYVGVSPGWVIRRFRIHEATDRVARGNGIDWSALASELGYFDQAHFIHEFKAQVGRTPGEYAELCAKA
jgi:AraC-like DNA-binding protein